MAPESPGNLVSLDLVWREEKLECIVDRYDSNGSGLDFLQVYWNALECPENCVSIGDNTAYVWVPPGFEHRRYRARVDKTADGYVWRDTADGVGLMLILTLPPMCRYILPTKGQSYTRPIQFKSTDDGRMALYWWLQGTNDRRVLITWQMECIDTLDIEAECNLLNEAIRQQGMAPVHSDPPLAYAGIPSADIPTIQKPPDFHNGIVISDSEPGHVRAASSLLLLITVLGALLGGILLVGGIYLALAQRLADTNFSLFGNNFSSTSVGVSMAFIGAILIILTFRRVLRSAEYLFHD